MSTPFRTRARDYAGRVTARLDLGRMDEVRWLLSQADIRRTDRILDVGCGSGYYTSIFARRAALAVGVDPNVAAIERASRRGFVRTEFKVGSAEALPLDDRSIDVVVGVCAMEHFGDHVRAVNEFGRVLKPGGRLVMSVDSLSLTRVTPAYREAHRRSYRVTRYFGLEDLRDLVEPRGFAIQAWRYLVATEAGGAAYRVLERLPTVPLRVAAQLTIYPMIRFADLVARSEDAGMKLCFAASLA